MVLSTQKKIISVVALGLSVVMLFGSTFAWQSLNQEALNYVKGGANPGGRLHDDFHNVTAETDPETGKPYTVKTFDKDVYVENFTSAADDGVNIYARIRLDEYLEWGDNAGSGSTDTTSLISGATFANKSSWTTYIPGQRSEFRNYWTLDWADGGSAVYMPTFNKNKDSLLADINGTFEGGYVKYALTEAEGAVTQKSGFVVQDKDANDEDELTDQAKLADLIQKGTESSYYNTYAENITVSSATHQAATSLSAGKSMSMADWLAAAERADDPNDLTPCWVYDTDGWFYWSAAIAPGTATGKLLDRIQRTGTVIGEDGDTWYYGLNVVAQFITSDSLGSAEENGGQGSGFYETAKGAAPTENALALLSAIGVNTTGEVGVVMLETESAEVRDAYELRLALESGSEQITLTDDIELDEPLIIKENAYVYLNGCSIAPSEAFDGRALFTVTDGAWLDFDERGIVQAPDDGYAVWVEEDGLLYIWDGTFVGGVGAIYVRSGEAVIVDGTFYLQGDEGQLLDWRSDDGKITVYGGVFYNFDPSNVNGESLLEDGYTVEVEAVDGDTIYTVTADIMNPLPEEPVLPNEELPVAGEDGEPTEDKLPGDGTESGDAMDEETPGEEHNGASPDVSGDTTDVPETSAPSVPDSSVTGNTDAGAMSGISGKADVVEPETPTDGGAETEMPDHGISAEDTAERSTDAETAE